MKRSDRKWRIIVMSMIMIVAFGACNRGGKSADHEERLLTQTYCGSCHLPVYPDMLDSITWIDQVLPAMAPRLGIGVWGRNNYFDQSDVKHEPRITFEQWGKLVAYYKEAAPKKLLPARPPLPLQKDWSVFQLHLPEIIDTHTIAATTLVRIDPVNHLIYSGDATTRQLHRWNQSLHPALVGNLSSAPVDLSLRRNGEGVVTCIGTLTGNNLNQINGEVFSINLQDDGAFVRMIAGRLPRPVQAVPGDFNKDGLEDWVVSGFGHDTGGLFLFRQTPDSSYERIVISDMPGAEHATVGDFNHDGWPDVMALFAQAREGIWLFLNDQQGGFSSKNLLEFPPVYGSTSFQVVDFNKDGHPDILYTCGDNADFSNILKPFHGVYIFMNKGDFNFDQAYFYPINGCTKAIAADFDGDGDLDIATIAFFADLENNPAESFIYFEQDSYLHFIPHAIPVSQYGRWISMDVGDYNGDGRPDIVLGNFSKGFGSQGSLKPEWNKYLPFIILSSRGIEGR